MFEGRPQESLLNADDRYLSQLSGQITWLRELIVVMVEQDRDTRRQSELLFEMVRTLRAAKHGHTGNRSEPAQEARTVAATSRPLVRS